MKAVAVLITLAVICLLEFTTAGDDFSCQLIIISAQKWLLHFSAPTFEQGRIERSAKEPEPTEGAPEGGSEKPEEEEEEAEDEKETSEDESGGDETEGDADGHGKGCHHDEDSEKSEDEQNVEEPAKSEKWSSDNNYIILKVQWGLPIFEHSVIWRAFGNVNNSEDLNYVMNYCKTIPKLFFKIKEQSKLDTLCP